MMAARACTQASEPAGTLRLGPVRGIPSVLADLGVSAERVFRSAGLDLRLFDDPDNSVRFDALGRLLDVCVSSTGCAHFGALVGERTDLASFGSLGQLMRNAPTVGDALRDLVRHLPVDDRGGAPVLMASDPTRVTFGYSIYRQQTPAAEMLYAGAVAIADRVLRELCGPAFAPLGIQFAFDPQGRGAAYRRAFRARVTFDAPISGVVFAASWLSRPLAGAQPAVHRELSRSLRAADDAALRLGERLEGVLHQTLMSGPPSAVAIARHLAMHERTLRRRLAAEGTSLRRLTNRTRFEMAGQLLRNTRLTVTEIAAVLQYADSNAFSRAFREWAGCPPTQWRQR